MAKKKKSRNEGKIFESNFETSVSEHEDLWSFRVRDVNPTALKNNFAIPKNMYDMLIFNGEILFTLELKSTKANSISHRGTNPQIKNHQVEALEQASTFKNIISGFILNFREQEKTYFIHIDDFLEYDAISKGEKKAHYRNKHNEKSIPINICEEIGTEVLSIKKRVHHRYFISDFLNNAIFNHKTKNNT